MRNINSIYSQGTDLFPDDINQDRFNTILDFVTLDEKKALDETLVSTVDGISVTVLV